MRIRIIETEIYDNEKYFMVRTAIYQNEEQLNAQCHVYNKDTGQEIFLDDVWELDWKCRDTTKIPY